MPTSPESAVKKLSRLPSNCICANCGATCKYGFSTVCIKYLTFVCNACKSSHQAVSHRCKSLTMSSWDQGEVLKLKMHGNDYARKVWLGNAPPVGVGGRPKEGDDINVFKRFVVEAYENKRYYKEPSADGGNERAEEVNAPFPSPHANHAPRHSVSRPKPVPPPSKQPQRHAPVVSAPVPPPAPVVDLLDFGAFDTAVAPTTLPPVQAAHNTPSVDILQAPAATVAASASESFFDPFNNNPQNPNDFSAGSNMVQGNATVDTNNTIPFQSSNKDTAASLGASNNAGSSTTFDPFGNITISTSSQANINEQQPSQKVVMKTPVMAMNHSGGMMNGVTANTNQINTMTNGGMMGNNPASSMMMNGGMNSGNAMMANNNMALNGGTNSGNAMMANNNMAFMGNNMMASGGMGAGMMNHNTMMMNGGMNMNGNMNGTVTQQYQQQQLPAMNMNVMKPMNNSISNNFRAGAATAAHSAGGRGSVVAATKPNQKADPFAGLGF